MEYLIEEGEVRSVLAPHHSLLAECVQDAWKVWREEIAPKFPDPLRRTLAATMANLIHDRVIAKLADVPGVKLIVESERLLLTFEQRFILRIKKLDESFHTRNYRTATSRAIDGQKQVTLEFIDDETNEPFVVDLPRVVLGYQHDQLRVYLEGVYIVHLKGDQLLWKYRIDDAGDMSEPLLLPFPSFPQGGARVGPRVNPVQNEADDGTVK